MGAGAIGGFIAAALARAGNPVAVVTRGEHLAAIARDGLRVESDIGSFTAPVRAAEDLRVLGEFDALLLTFKAHQWPSFLPQLQAVAGKPVAIVTLQNGLPFWYVRRPPMQSVDPGGRIEQLFPDDRVLGGVVHVSGKIVAPGVVRQSGGLRYVLGEPGGGTARAETLAAVLRDAGLAPELDHDIRATVWLKLVNNAALNSTSVLRHATIKTMLADLPARTLVRRLMTEALVVGEAIGAVSGVDVDARIAYASRLDDVKTSMLQDYEHGRRLEIDPIVGAVIELAQRHGIAVPCLRETYAELQRLETVSAAQ